MSTTAANHHPKANDKVVFGLWTFILSDCILFATLFVCYAVLHTHTYGNIGIKSVAQLPYVFITGLFLLATSMTYGFSSYGFEKGKKGVVWFWLLITLILGLAFVGFEYHEFAYLLHHGASWKDSAFLSAFFALVGIHWFHVIGALIWLAVLLIQFLSQPLNDMMRTRLTCVGLFIHFLNAIWIFIFTLVYLLGAF